MNKKIAWCITGGEYFLKDVLEFLNTSGHLPIKVFISKAALEIIRFFELEALIPPNSVTERSYSGLEILGLLSGKINKTVIAPCSANTVAKLVCGIADSLCTNLVAQTQKMGIKTYVLPTDVQDTMSFHTKSGKKIQLKRRKIDKENIEKLQDMELFKVFFSFEDLKKEILRETT